MMVNMSDVKQVRDRSGAPMNACKVALDEAGGSVDGALEVLQKKGILKAAALASKEATDGVVTAYLHGGRIGVLLEVNCTTDFVARSEDFRAFVDEVAMQVAAMSPRWVSSEDIPKDVVDKQAEIFTEQLRGEGKPEKAWAKIVGGKLTKWYSETCLLDQESVVHPKQTVEHLRAALVAKIGENVKVRRFVRWEVGEGIERAAKEDYASEVAGG